jgi:hypothetical protein
VLQVETQRLDRFANKGKIDAEGYQAYSPVCRDCENIGRSSNKVLKNVIKKGDIKKENGSISATKMESTGTVNMYLTLDGSGTLLPVLIFAIWGEDNYAAFISISTDQIDGTGDDLKIVEAAVGIRHEFIRRGRCVKIGFAGAQAKKSLYGRITFSHVLNKNIMLKEQHLAM